MNTEISVIRIAMPDGTLNSLIGPKMERPFTDDECLAAANGVCPAGWRWEKAIAKAAAVQADVVAEGKFGHE